MIKESDNHSLKLHEHTEMGSLCRSYEQLSRAGLAIYTALSTAIIGFLLKETDLTARITLEVAGLLFTLFMLNMSHRLRVLYTTYVQAAKDIEKELGMKVYLRWEDALRHSFTVPNKLAIMLLMTIFGLYFFALLAIDLHRMFRD